MDASRAVLIRYSRDGKDYHGSGLLLDHRWVLTADHCANGTGHKVAFGGNSHTATEIVRSEDPKVDLALLKVPGLPEVPGLGCGYVDRGKAYKIVAQVLGYPWWKSDAEGSSVRVQCDGYIPTSEGGDAPHAPMTLRITDQQIRDLPVLKGNLDQPGSVWAGMSGAVVLAQDRILAVVSAHAAAEGTGALTLTPLVAVANLPERRRVLFEAALSCAFSPATERTAGEGKAEWGRPVELLPDTLTEQPITSLVELQVHGGLPLVKDLNPYTLGASRSDYGDKSSYGQADPYVPRTQHLVDQQLRSVLQPGCFVLLVGPPKAGKTRTAFEAIRVTWPNARLVKPDPATISELARHPLVAHGSEPMVFWLDDFAAYLSAPDSLSPATVALLRNRPGRAVLLGTIRDDELALGRPEPSSSPTGRPGAPDAVGRARKAVLGEATLIQVGPLREAPDERSAAAEAYPEVDLSSYGLGEQLAGGPALLALYRAWQEEQPIEHAAVQCCIDWTRVGITRPIPEDDLTAMMRESLWLAQPDLAVSDHDLASGVASARSRQTDPDGRALPTRALRTIPQPDHVRSYLAFSYLVAVDEGPDPWHSRPIPDFVWAFVTQSSQPDDRLPVSWNAHMRGQDQEAVAVLTPLAAQGNLPAMEQLGWLLVTPSTIFDGDQYRESPHYDPVRGRKLLESAGERGSAPALAILGWQAFSQDPPDLIEARRLWLAAAKGGDTYAMLRLGDLIVGEDPADALIWYQQAAQGGDPEAMLTLGYHLLPNDTKAARHWFERAAAAGQPDAYDAYYNLGCLILQSDTPQVDTAKALFEEAARHGVPDAIYALGWIAETFEHDFATAKRLYLDAGAAGSATAAEIFNVKQTR